jgi:exonuclease SbcC
VIDRIVLTNWQCHSSLILDLEPVTVLVGDNECGKSAVLRAVRWVALNQWDGRADEHVTWGADHSLVGLTLEDGCLVTRKKGKTVNDYILDGQTFMAGKIVPSPVAKVLKLGEANFADQDDPPFWLSLGPAQAAVALNDLFHLSQIDTSASRIASELRTAQTTAKVVEARLEAARGQRKALDWAVQAHKDLAEIETLVQQISGLDQEIARAERARTEVGEVEGDLEKSTELLLLGSSVLALMEEGVRLDSRLTNWKLVIDLEDSLCQQRKELKAKEAQLRKWLAGTCPLCGRSR